MAIALGSSQVVQEAGTVTYTAAAGSNRIVVLSVGAEDVTVAFAPTFGGISFVAVESDPFIGVSGTDVYLGYILEANIPAGSQTVVVSDDNATWTNNTWGGVIYTLTGCDQSTVPNPDAAEDNHNSPATSHVTSNVTSVTGGVLIAHFTGSSAATAHTITGYTSSADNDEGGGSWVSGYKLISSGVSEAATFEHVSSESGASSIFGLSPSSGIGRLGGIDNRFNTFIR